MKKILVLASENIHEPGGLLHAVINRTRHLMEIADYDIDIIIISTYEPWYIRKLRHTNKKEKINNILVDGVNINIKWSYFTLIDYILVSRLHKAPIFQKIKDKNIVSILKKYDFVIAHSYRSGKIAREAKKRYGIPYSITWHGSDIHTLPFNNKSTWDNTVSIMEDANINFFVSKALLETSNALTSNAIKDVLYNGCNQIFTKYSEERKRDLRKSFNVENKRVVLFAGAFRTIKNILIIPKIFRLIFDKYKNVEFWMVGDGKYRSQVEQLSKGLPVKFWGVQSADRMPDIVNCADVQILPSRNEGLPLTMVEALRCGCNAVGSMVGGIPEVIGKENCIELDSKDFIEKFANRVVFLLNDPYNQCLDEKFDWKVSAKKEQEITNKILLNSANDK